MKPCVGTQLTQVGFGDQEVRIRHFHKTIDDYIYGPGKKPDGAL